MEVTTLAIVPYEVMFGNLDLEHKKYYLKFMYDTCNTSKRFELDKLQEIILHEECLIIINKEDDRFLFKYDNLDLMVVICMGEKE